MRNVKAFEGNPGVAETVTELENKKEKVRNFTLGSIFEFFQNVLQVDNFLDRLLREKIGLFSEDNLFR